jgi:hypothetical protein
MVHVVYRGGAPALKDLVGGNMDVLFGNIPTVIGLGFAFSAIAAAMIFHLVPDNVQAVQIMMVASIGIFSLTLGD